MRWSYLDGSITETEDIRQYLYNIRHINGVGNSNMAIKCFRYDNEFGACEARVRIIRVEIIIRFNVLSSRQLQELEY